MELNPRLIILQPTSYCNIQCSYCYLRHRDDRALMSDEVVRAIRGKIIEHLPTDASPAVVWHAGEPTAAPLEWYERAYATLLPAAPPATSFAMQSNGVAIDAAWVRFFSKTNTNIGLSIDGPRYIHDSRRRARNGKGTWTLAMRGLRLLQQAGLEPRLITVLHPDHLTKSEDYYRFYVEHGITQVSFSIDESEGANGASSFAGVEKGAVAAFFASLMDHAYRDGYPLHIREIERVAHLLAGVKGGVNEQVEPWASIVVAANGAISTYSPEFMEARAPEYDNFVLGNIMNDDIATICVRPQFAKLASLVAQGVAACKADCRYFGLCGGGSPVNKYCEKSDLTATETQFCKLTTQAAADALLAFLASHRKATERTPDLKCTAE